MIIHKGLNSIITFTKYKNIEPTKQHFMASELAETLKKPSVGGWFLKGASR